MSAKGPTKKQAKLLKFIEDYIRTNDTAPSYREIRDAAAKQQFGKPYSKCSAEQREQLMEKYPQRVQEVY